MDMDEGWPRPLVTERSEVRTPMSLGLRLEGAERAEAEIVLYAGGWADVLVAASGSEPEQVSQEYVELEAADEFGKLLDRVVTRMVGQAP
jgi:hypothetical protein